MIAASVRVLTSRVVKVESHSYAHAHVWTIIFQPTTVSLDFIAYSGDYGHESALETASPHSFLKTNRLVEPIKDTGENEHFSNLHFILRARCYRMKAVFANSQTHNADDLCDGYTHAHHNSPSLRGDHRRSQCGNSRRNCLVHVRDVAEKRWRYVRYPSPTPTHPRLPHCCGHITSAIKHVGPWDKNTKAPYGTSKEFLSKVG